MVNVWKGTDIMSIEIAGVSPATLLSQVYQANGSDRPARTGNAVLDGAAGQDILTLSSQGRGVLELASLFAAESGESITGDTITEFGEKKLAEFGQQLRAMMRGNGIDTSIPVTLGHEYGTGRVIVTSDHPDAEKIENLINNNLELRNTYTAATNALEFARHAAEHTKFAEAYAANPQMAVAQYAYLFNTSWQAEVTFSDEGHSVAYNRTARS